MKLSLVVMSDGKASGKAIPITLSQFIIGRDPQCQLRPASAIISKRHCAVISRAGKFFIRDFDSTNGTFLNDEWVKGERELKQDDILKVGPLTFRIAIEGSVPAPAPAPVPVNKPTPLPRTLDKTKSADESVADMLLDLADESDTPPLKTSDSVPDGTTIMDLPSPFAAQPPAAEQKPPEPAKADAKPPEKKVEKKKETGNTSAAAKAILDKYTRRTR